METPLDRVARALSHVPIRHTEEGLPVTLDLAICLDLALAALSVIHPETDCQKQRIAEPGDNATPRVLPARFITDAMADIPDHLPPDFA
ncbi:hypothetical protein ACFQ7W_00665 [Streptomyces niveus]|uniref:hypothetical protein n=1 Tax=Streptomyces niveus TaxID=193462 RepID=UPI0036906325